MGQSLRIITLVNGRELKGPEAERVRVEASYGIMAGKIIDDQHWEVHQERHRPADIDDRPSIKRAMVAVETSLVEALWTLARLPDGGSGGGSCGVSYIQDASDRWANAVERGWETVMPRPSRPSPRAIDQMHGPLGWLSLLPRDHAQLVSIAAGTKRGEIKRRVAWNRVRSSLPQVAGQSLRTLQRRYEGGIREIVSRLTEKAMSERI